MPDTSSPVRIDLEEADSFQRVAHIQVENDHMEKLRDKVAAKLAKKVRMDGFRPGKVPVKKVRAQFAHIVEQDALEALVPDVYKRILDEHDDVHPIADPRVENFDMPEGEPLAFDLVIEVRPDIEITGLDAVEATHYLPPITDERIDQAISDLADRHATWNELGEGDAAAEGDAILMDMVPLDDEKNPVADEATEDQAVMVGDDKNLPEINSALIGMHIGEETDVEVAYPVDFPNEDLQGTIRTLRVKMKEIRRKDVPAIDDAFAKEHQDKDSLEELRADIKQRMEKGVEQEAERHLRDQIIDRLLASNAMPVPPSLERRYLDAMLHDAIHQQPGMDPNDHDHDISDEMREKFDEAYKPVAERAVRKMVLLDNLRRQHEFDVTDEDVTAKLESLAEEQGTTPDHLRSLIERAGNMDRLRSDLEEDKVFDLLKSKAAITVKEELPPAPETMPTQQEEASDEAQA